MVPPVLLPPTVVFAPSPLTVKLPEVFLQEDSVWRTGSGNAGQDHCQGRRAAGAGDFNSCARS